MSTKIFYAYRMKKSKVDNIFDLLYEWRLKATDEIKNNKKLLEKIHMGAFYYIVLNTEDVEEREKKMKEYNDGRIGWTIREYLETYENQLQYHPIATYMKLEANIFMDDEYWYFKFFPNESWAYDFLNNLEKDYDGFEDYHYQNSTDKPDDISHEDYRKRDEKWEELTERSGGNYRDGLSYTIFDAIEFDKLLSVYAYIGRKENEDLYEHLAYKFDKPLMEEKKND